MQQRVAAMACESTAPEPAQAWREADKPARARGPRVVARLAGGAQRGRAAPAGSPHAHVRRDVRGGCELDAALGAAVGVGVRTPRGRVLARGTGHVDKEAHFFLLWRGEKHQPGQIPTALGEPCGGRGRAM